jgi:hypothetical protein
VEPLQAPLPAKTTPIVRVTILKSSQMHQLLMMVTSSETTLANEGSLDPCTCHSPVIHGVTSRRRRWLRSYFRTSPASGERGAAIIRVVDHGAGIEPAKYNSLQRAPSALSVVIFASNCSTFLSRLFMSARKSSR